MADGEGSVNGLQLCTRWWEASDRGAAILHYILEQVPHIYCLEAEPQPVEEEQQVQEHILYPLECFLFGEDPSDGLQKLEHKNYGSSSQQCGRVFKEGETVYSCRDCAIDPTCVLCMDCFQNSVHKGHRYKMHASSGGGFCDCGDLEAWKTGPCCSQHDLGTSVAMETDDCVLEAELQERAQTLFQVLLCYITDLMVWEEGDELSEEMKQGMNENTYYCVLYNDEHHSYDQVIYALQRAISCDHNEAHTHTALIDKEGRRAVKRGTLRTCQQVKDLIRSNSEHITQQALRVEILHSAVMAHQTFALRLGAWLQQIIGYSVGFRQVFCQVALEPGADSDKPCLISRLMLHDARLYKGARKVIHELIFCSLLMETEYKKQFAMKFTEVCFSYSEICHSKIDHTLIENIDLALFVCILLQHYKQLQEDFISDDHERNISVTALSVQIFTVPTLARQLIEEGSVIKVIIDTVMEMLREHLDNNQRFHFQGYNSDKFFRVQVIFHDLRYILISKPTTWTEQLRGKFLEGFSAFLGLLNCMQGMEEVKRQFGQHIEVEPEWEAGFSIQIQLRHILSMFQDWCSSDERVLLLAFQECHRALLRCTNQPFHSEPTDSYMCKHILHKRPYKVSQEPVSIHLPITRLLAGLYVLLCRADAVKYLSDFVDPEHLDFSAFAEHPLRCVVLAAEVSAEMWRRNGLSLVSQVYYYQDVKCRDEMFDKDIIMLQIAASKMDPNHFLMLILLRFELFEVFNGNCSSKDQDLLKQWNRLTEEMLNLLIVIVGERYVPGISNVTKQDVTMREVIHLLCIEPMAHSSLVKGLPENESHETGLESVIAKVATFKKPGVSGHGLYELKKECLKEFNPFFYHYTKSQHSKAEDAQKKRRAQDGSDKALRPPVPPPFAPAFSSIVRLLCCDVFIHVLRRVLQRAVEERCTLWSEAMIQRALHLVGQALIEEKTQLEASNVDEVSFDFSHKARTVGSDHGKSLFHFLSQMKKLPSLDAQKDMINWLLQMFEIVKCLREKSSPSAVCAVDQTKPEESFQDRKRKAEAAKLHRQKIMAQMSAMQKNFIETHKMLYDNVPESGSQGEPAAFMDCAMEFEERHVAVGPQQGVCPADWEALTCILCQEEQEVQAQAPAMVLTACVQRSTVLTQYRGKTLSTKEGSYPLFMPPDLAVGTHTGSCGHVMHATCWQKYFEAVQNTTRNRLHAELIIDLENGEYMCPLCKSLCNTVVPLIPLEPSKLNYESAKLVGEVLTLPRWIQIVVARIKGLRPAQRADSNADVGKEETGFLEDDQTDFRSIHSFGVRPPPKYSSSITEMLVVCATTVHRVGLQTAPNELCPHVPVMTWNTCAYTIQAIENMLQEEGKALFGSLQNRQLSGLKAVVQFSAVQRLKSSQTVTQKHFTDMLAVLVPVPDTEGTLSVLEVDFFHLLVGLVLSIPALYQEENVDLQPSAISTAYNHLHLVQLLTMAHIVQVLLSSHDTSEVIGGGDEEESKAAEALYSTVSQHTEGLRTSVSGSMMADRVRRGVLPFLRCAALFFNCLTGVPPPEALSSTADSPDSHLPLLCSYLALPCNLFQLFQEHRDTVTPLIQRWCGNEAILKALKGEINIVRYPRKRNRLIDLPEDYSVLLNQASHFKCPKSSDDERKHPTLCLFCGTMLCSQSPCCHVQLDGEEVGACTAHAASCGAGVGMFLRVRECEIVLMASRTRGSTYPAPYLDDYGETDPQLGRGNPLHLCPERYKKLQQLWQQHCILEEIARSLEVLNVMFAFEWQML
ncbi:E3 ubiquitin-protein ligase UBR1 isoform X5 [Pygocentrus nattereri]|uniref:E3 ubiquitin-protein ligase UBR1 isoform X5 n=1 Tax=Pygocentrus nattereri TaxID=42514 RepID=UPI0018916F60|nr:E3 ubiquitin-protein ligase UBR1 isoform X5 [Pygocentrus nattereri]